jgi:hypothetical protein
MGVSEGGRMGVKTNLFIQHRPVALKVNQRQKARAKARVRVHPVLRARARMNSTHFRCSLIYINTCKLAQQYVCNGEEGRMRWC